MPIVQRFFRKDMLDDDRDMEEAQPLTSYIDKRVIVILGGPGIGKTTELEQAVAQEADAVFCTVSQFLADPIEQYQGKTIYLDALDEHRAELHQGKTIIDRIRGRLSALGHPKVRVSCRGEEWQQGSDVKSLSDVAGGEPVYILKMQPLGEEDIRAIALEKINDVDSFLAGAQERQLEELLGNPETLKLYLKVYKNGGGWPETRAELMEQSTNLLISEENEQHERARGNAISNDCLIRAAEDLSAILLFGDKEGVALSKVSVSDHYIPLQELSGIDLDAISVAARRRLFSSDSPEQVHPRHKTTGDYLAAKALVRRIQDKSLPLGRALSLLTGKDGGPLSHLRDVYAWLVALLPEYAEQLIKEDPFGALIYGDAGQWSVATRRAALKLLSVYAVNKDPWFRADAWYVPLLGGLAHSELAEDFRNTLKTESCPHVTSVVLSALEYGKPLPELGDDLLSFIRDPGRPSHDWLRDDALRVFTRACPERIDDRKQLLEEIRSGVLLDDDQMLRIALLNELYPSEIESDRVAEYLAETSLGVRGRLDWFVRNDLVARTPEDKLPSLAEAILKRPDNIKSLDDFDRRGLNGSLVKRLLEAYGESAPAEQIYMWLGIYMDKHHTTCLDKDDSDVIRNYFNAHPQLYIDLFCYWLGRCLPDENQGYAYYHFGFRARLLGANYPLDFTEKLLAWAAIEKVSDRATFLFEEAADMIMREAPGTFSVGMEDLCSFVDDHPIFTEVWEKKNRTEIPEWRLEQSRGHRDYSLRQEAIRERDIEILTQRLDILRTGKDIQNLDFGAKVWFGLQLDEQKEVSPINRLRQKLNDEILLAMIGGFEALLRSDKPHTPAEIAALNCNDKHYYDSYPILAGADNLVARSLETFLALPEANLKTALACHLILSIGGEARAWDKEIMDSHPSLARGVLAEIWRAELAGGKKEYLNGAYVGRTEDISTPIILSEIPILLKENPAPPSPILENLLKTIMHHGNSETLRPLVKVVLDNMKVRGEARALWLSVAALLDPDAYAEKLECKIISNTRNSCAAHGILTAGALMNGQESAPQLQMSISILGKLFNNVQILIGDRVDRDRGKEDKARSIRGLIDTLAGLPTAGATQAFEILIADPALHQWHDHLRHNQAIQAKNLRDTHFERPLAQDVCNLLAGGAPTNMEDFQAMALDILDEITADIRGDSANMWKSFWTHAGRGALDKPKIENDSRDVMLPWIRPYLSSNGITIEPEAAAADQKRVDIRLTHADTGTLPIEVKRDDNAELWTAMQDQLMELYTNDRKTGGYGIYLVLWHGNRGRGCQTPPKRLGIDKPTTALELLAALEAIKPSLRLVVRVIDVSKPHDS
jgi:hypothetical protein